MIYFINLAAFYYYVQNILAQIMQQCDNNANWDCEVAVGNKSLSVLGGFLFLWQYF